MTLVDNGVEGVYNRHFGPWRSLASALAWGARGPEFKSRRPDQTSLQHTAKAFIENYVLESNWSPNPACGDAFPERTEYRPKFLAPLYSQIKPDKPDIFD